MKNACATGRALRPEVDLLCACIRPTPSGAIEDGHVRDRSIDWKKFAELATNHHVLPLAYRTLKSEGNAGRVPAEWMDRLRVFQTAIAAYNLRATALLHRLQQMMESQGIQLIPIKGPALAVWAFGDVAMRQFEDLDLIVRREDLLRAVDLLEQDGFGLRELAGSVDRARYLATLQNWSLEKPGSPPLDLKPVLVSHAFCGPSSAEFMASACRRIPVDGKRSLWMPGPEAMLLAVCMDGANEMWVKLSSVADAGALLAKHADLDWGAFLSEAARFGQRRSMLVGACLVEELLGVAPPPAFRKEEEKDPAARRLAREAAERLRTLAPRHDVVFRQSCFAFRTRERAGDRFRFLSRLLFVPGAFELASMPLPGVLNPLHSLVRPFRLAWDVAVRRGRSRRLTARPTSGKLTDDAKGP